MALDYFEMECSEEKGGNVYLEIASDILKDLNLLSIISRLQLHPMDDVNQGHFSLPSAKSVRCPD